MLKTHLDQHQPTITYISTNVNQHEPTTTNFASSILKPGATKLRYSGHRRRVAEFFGAGPWAGGDPIMDVGLETKEAVWFTVIVDNHDAITVDRGAALPLTY